MPKRATTDEMMQALASGIDEALNGTGPRSGHKVGFVLLTFPLGELGKDRLNLVNYIGNGDRKDVYAALKELLARWDGQITDQPCQHNH